MQMQPSNSPKMSVSSASTDSLIQPFRVSKKVKAEAEEYLKEKNVDIGRPVMAKRIGAVVGDLSLTTNIYPTALPGLIQVHRYDVSIVGESAKGREIPFTKKFKDDYTQADRRFRSRDVITTFMRKYNAEATKAGCMYNDLQSIMYTLMPFAEPIVPKQSKEYKFDVAELSNAECFQEFGIVTVHLVITAIEGGAMSLSGVTEQSDLLFVNRDLAQFLDIATSQECFFREGEHVHFSTKSSYLYRPFDFGYSPDDVCDFPENDSYLGIGCDKAVHVVQGDLEGIHRGTGLPAVVIQPKKTPFHNNNPLLVKVQALIQSQRFRQDPPPRILAQILDKWLKGLVVETTHLTKKQFFAIKGFDPEGANKLLEIDGETITHAEFFRRKFEGTPLSYPNMPLVIKSVKDLNGKQQLSYFPIELLVVCDNQRVKTGQLLPTMNQLAIKKCAVPPSILKEQVRKAAMSMHLFESDYLQRAEIRVNEPLTVPAHLLQHPEIRGGAGVERPRHDMATWRGERVLHPQGLTQQYGWAVFVFGRDRDRSSLNQRDLDGFLDMYMQQARRRNIPLGEPRKKEICTISDPKQIAPYFDWASKEGLAFLLCFHGDLDEDHHEIKANERRYFVISQCVKLFTARNVVQKGQRLTVDNILNKTNMKMGGLNFTLHGSGIATDTKTLVIGISSNHPAGGFGAKEEESEDVNPNKPPSFVDGPPTAVGYAANVGPTKMPFDFVGDFVFQHARRLEKVNVIETIVQRCLHYFTSVRGAMPERVIVYRNDCSEGQYAALLKYDIPVLKAAFAAEGCTAPLTLIVCQKLSQAVRFFQHRIDSHSKPPDQNLKPGTVVDACAVHPLYAEFFLNSHRALQGTARTPKYTVLYDDTRHTLADLERITYDLCFGHQIVFSPTSLPAPVYIASMYGKRGRNLYNSCVNDLKAENPNLGMSQLNEKVSFYDRTGQECWIAEYRVNA